jgi:HSP20 family protein
MATIGLWSSRSPHVPDFVVVASGDAAPPAYIEIRTQSHFGTEAPMAKSSLTPTTGREHAPVASEGWSRHPLQRFHDEFDRLFEGFFSGFPLARWSGGNGDGFRVPEVDLSENDKEYCIEAELPGLDEKEVSLTLHDGVLTLKGEKKEEKKEERKDYHFSERRWGSFQRSLRLPDDVDENKVSADFKKGVLTVHLPKSAEAQKSARRIEIKGS